MRWTGSPSFGLTRSVAPSLVASCSFTGLVSMAMMRPAPAIAAPLIAAMPTPPQPMTATVSPGATLARVHCRTVAGDDGAADERGAVEGEVVADLHHGILVDEHHLGVGGQVGEGVQLLAAEAQALRDPRQHLHARVGADERPSGRAVVAGAAEHREAGDDVVALPNVADLGADRFDDAGELVTQDHGKRMRVEPLDEMQVGMA